MSSARAICLMPSYHRNFYIEVDEIYDEIEDLYYNEQPYSFNGTNYVISVCSTSNGKQIIKVIWTDGRQTVLVQIVYKIVLLIITIIKNAYFVYIEELMKKRRKFIKRRKLRKKEEADANGGSS